MPYQSLGSRKSTKKGKGGGLGWGTREDETGANAAGYANLTTKKTASGMQMRVVWWMKQGEVKKRLVAVESGGGLRRADETGLADGCWV